mgnify:FL=1
MNLFAPLLRQVFLFCFLASLSLSLPIHKNKYESERKTRKNFAYHQIFVECRVSLYISQLYLSIWIENLNIFFISFTFAISLSILLLAEQNLYLTFCRLKRLHLPVPHFRLWVVMVVKRKLMKNLHHLRLKKQSELFQIYYHGKFAMCMTMWQRKWTRKLRFRRNEKLFQFSHTLNFDFLIKPDFHVVIHHLHA